MHAHMRLTILYTAHSSNRLHGGLDESEDRLSAAMHVGGVPVSTWDDNFISM